LEDGIESRPFFKVKIIDLIFIKKLEY